MKLFFIYISLVFSFFLQKGYRTGLSQIVSNDVKGYVNKGEAGIPQYIGKLDNFTQINFIGDSIVYGMISGFNEENDKNLCHYISKGLDIEVNNYGIGGNLLSMDSVFGDAACKRIKEIEYKDNDITILFSGTNDCGVNIPINMFEEAYLQAVENWMECSKPGAKLVLVTILPRTNFIKAEGVYVYSNKYSNTYRYSQKIRDIYARYSSNSSIYLCDIEKECTGTKNGGLPNARIKKDNVIYYGNNGLHPNLTGYFVFGTWFSKYLYSNFGIAK